jgi:CheY-like chemotaxis protein
MMNRSSEPESKRFEPRRILVVDDEAEVRDLFQELFTQAGFEVDTAASGSEAMARFSARSYHLITLDVAMPDMNGLEFHRALSQGFGFGQQVSALLPQKLPPILVITGYADDTVVRDLVFGERVAGVIQKPVRADHLLRTVRELLEWEEARIVRRQKALSRLSDRLARKVPGA